MLIAPGAHWYSTPSMSSTLLLRQSSSARSLFLGSAHSLLTRFTCSRHLLSSVAVLRANLELVNFRRGMIALFLAFLTLSLYSVTIRRLVRSFSWCRLSSDVYHMSASWYRCLICVGNRRPPVCLPLRLGWDVPLKCTVCFLLGRCGFTLIFSLP